MASTVSVSVPGAVAGAELAAKTYGTRPLSELMAPAVELADKGFPITEALGLEFSIAGWRGLGGPKGMPEDVVATLSAALDEIVGQGGEIEKGYKLRAKSTGSEAEGCLFLQTHSVTAEIPESVASKKADNVILGVALHLKQKYPKREVVLVSKDINMRIKAHALGLAAEDYFNDKVLEDADLLYTGVRPLPPRPSLEFERKQAKRVLAELRRLHEAVLRQEPSLARAVGDVAAAPHAVRRVSTRAAKPLSESTSTGRTPKNRSKFSKSITGRCARTAGRIAGRMCRSSSETICILPFSPSFRPLT